VFQIQPGRFAAHFGWEKSAGERERLGGGMFVDRAQHE